MADGQLSNPTHPTPPRTEEERLDVLRLIRSRRVGAVTFHRLMAEHGTAGCALRALPEIARLSGVNAYEPCPESVARAELRAGERAGARALFHGDPFYPAALASLTDAPPVLWLRGDVGLLSRPMIAIIGARNASSLGVRMARRLAADLGQAGFCIVSGLARGIDAEAHLAALGTGTIAVQAGGINVIYPGENARLAADIALNGLIVTEQPPGAQPQARHFPLRNRIVSGLSAAVLVIEAAARSGSLITARLALDQGREVMAVPGHPFDARASGCNQLIRDGACLLRQASDALELLGIDPGAVLRGDAAGDAPQRDCQAAEGQTPEDARGQGRSPQDGRTAPAQISPAPRSLAPAYTGSGAGQESPNPSRSQPDATTLQETIRLHNLILARLGPSPLPEDQLMRDLSLPSAQLIPELLTLELAGRIQRQPGGLLSTR